MTNPKKDWKEWKDPFLEREKKKKNWKEKDLFKPGTRFFPFPFQQILASAHLYLPLVPRTSDGPTWSNGWATTGAHLDMIAKQYKNGTRMGKERGKNGKKTG